MSAKAMGWALEQKTALPVDKLVLIAVANFAGDDHSSHPSRKTVADMAMCSLDTVDRALKRLEESGLLTKTARVHEKGGPASNVYTLPLAAQGSRNLRPAAPCGEGVAAEVRPGQPHNDAARVAAQDAATKEPLKEPSKEPTPIAPKGGPTPMDALKAFEAYNATALRCGLPQASTMSKDRQRKIIARLRDYGLDGWAQALANVEKSSFLTGKNDRGWRANLDWLVGPEKFGKVHDGSYGNGRHAEIKAAAVAAPPPNYLPEDDQDFMAAMAKKYGYAETVQ